MLSVETLFTIASDFRSAFEKLDLTGAPGFLPNFPNGCCSWATWMVGHFLEYEMNEPVEEVNAERMSESGSETHAWLSANGVTIDITSDEFQDSSEKVIVSSDSAWHRTWKVVERAPIERIETYNQIDFRSKLKPSEVYELLVLDIRKKYAHNKLFEPTP